MPAFINLQTNNKQTGNVHPAWIQVELIVCYEKHADGSTVWGANGVMWFANENPDQIGKLIAEALTAQTLAAYGAIRAQVTS